MTEMCSIRLRNFTSQADLIQLSIFSFSHTGKIAILMMYTLLGLFGIPFRIDPPASWFLQLEVDRRHQSLPAAQPSGPYRSCIHPQPGRCFCTL